MTRVLAVTTSRADYTPLGPVLKALEADDRCDLHVVITGSHTSAHLGDTGRLVEADGYQHTHTVEMLLASDSPEAIAKATGLSVISYAQLIGNVRPDVILLLGDRFEMHAAAVAAVAFRVPVAHIHGGEVTEGAFDDALRHSLTKLSHLHFVATAEYGRRVVQLGEEPWRVTVSGAPALDAIATTPRWSRRQIAAELGIHIEPEFVLATFHPATLETEDPSTQADIVLAALVEVGLPVVVTMPNIDPGGGDVRRTVLRYAASCPHIQPIESAGTAGYFSLMAAAACMVGNSSSGIIEAPSFGLPVVNIGRRQAGRVRGENVIDVPCARAQIVDAVRRAMSPSFRERARRASNPYGDGSAAERIAERLARQDWHDPALVAKRFHDAEGAG